MLGRSPQKQATSARLMVRSNMEHLRRSIGSDAVIRRYNPSDCALADLWLHTASRADDVTRDLSYDPIDIRMDAVEIIASLGVRKCRAALVGDVGIETERGEKGLIEALGSHHGLTLTSFWHYIRFIGGGQHSDPLFVFALRKLIQKRTSGMVCLALGAGQRFKALGASTDVICVALELQKLVIFEGDSGPLFPLELLSM